MSERAQTKSFGFGRPTTVAPLTVVAPRGAAPRSAAPWTAPAVARRLESARAMASGAIDEFTFGGADHLLAAGQALSGGVSGYRARYDAAMRQKRAEDARDARLHPMARNAGRVAGLGATLFLGGPAAGAARAALAAAPRGGRVVAALTRTPKLTGLDPRGLNNLVLAGGATSGVVSQAVVDAATGRLSSARDYTAAVVGGAAGGYAALRTGGMGGGLVGGGATSATRDVLDGRRISLDDAIREGHLGMVGGGAAEAAGTLRAAMLSTRAKGLVGEKMSQAKLLATGRHVRKNKIRVNVEGRTPTGRQSTSVPDYRFGPKDSEQYLEAKLGPEADLTRNQKRLLAKVGSDRFRVDAWQFSDVGKASSVAGAGVSGKLQRKEPPR